MDFSSNAGVPPAIFTTIYSQIAGETPALH
jgi:hypothetical protein